MAAPRARATRRATPRGPGGRRWNGETGGRLPARRPDAICGFLSELKTLAPRKAAGLGGGQGKRVALGRAMTVGTRAILLDEPDQGLAPALALRYGEALARLRDVLPDAAMLVTESSPDVLRPLVDRTIVIERGESSGASGPG